MVVRYEAAEESWCLEYITHGGLGSGLLSSF